MLYGKDPGYGASTYLKNVVPRTPDYQNTRNPNHSVTLTNLTPGATYYYAAFSTDAAGNTNVQEGSFIAGQIGTTGGTSGVPELLSPIATWVETTTPTFSWTAFAGADHYQIKVLDSSGATVVPVQTLGAVTSYPLSAGLALSDHSDYTWMLQAHAGDVWTGWSAAAFSVYTSVFVNLAKDTNVNIDDEHGLSRHEEEPCDGISIPQDFSSTPAMRKNKGTSGSTKCGGTCTDDRVCQYMYFDVDNRFISSDLPHPVVDVVVNYYDHKEDPDNVWAGYFCLKYKRNDTAHSSASSCLSSAINGSNTMKNFTFHLTDAYFGNIVNNNDFRLECRTNATGALSGDKDTRRWINMVTVIKE